MPVFEDLLVVQEHDTAADRLRHRRETLPELERLAKGGATDMVAAEFGSSAERERTRAFLRSLL